MRSDDDRPVPDKGPRYCQMHGIDVFYCEHHNSETCSQSCNYKGGNIFRRELARVSAKLRSLFGGRST